jgi:hypothetical protein
VSAITGLSRAVNALWHNRDDSDIKKRNEAELWGSHIIGALGECAYAKGTNVYYEPTQGTYHSVPDVDGVEVRTRTQPHYQLIIRSRDVGDRFYVLVRMCGHVSRWEIVGGILARDAWTHDEWVHDYGGHKASWFVPDEFLTPVNPRV